MKLDSSFTQHTKIHSKYIKDLNIKPEALILLEENISSKLLEADLSDDFGGILHSKQRQ